MRLNLYPSRNLTIDDYINELFNACDFSMTYQYRKRLYNCKAYEYNYILIFDDYHYAIKRLKSYDTVVAIHIKCIEDNKQWYVIGGSYSQTTIQHIHKWKKIVNLPFNSLLDIEYMTLYEI